VVDEKRVDDTGCLGEGEKYVATEPEYSVEIDNLSDDSSDSLN